MKVRTNFGLPMGLSVLDLGPMYATDRQIADVRRSSSLNAPYPSGGGIIREVTGGWPVLQLTSYIGEMSGVRDMPRLRRVRRDVGDLV